MNSTFKYIATIFLTTVCMSCKGSYCIGFGELYYRSDKPFRTGDEEGDSESKDLQFELVVTVTDIATETSASGMSPLVPSRGGNYYLMGYGYVGMPPNNSCYSEHQITLELIEKRNAEVFAPITLDKCPAEEMVIIKAWNEWPLQILCRTDFMNSIQHISNEE